MIASFPVRTRIVVLALIPVAGFLANGVTYVSGEGDVGRAFATVTQSHALADSSRDFKSAVASIAEGVSRASGEARVGAEAMSRVAGVTTDARRSVNSSPTCRRHNLAAEQWRSAPRPGLQSVQQ